MAPSRRKPGGKAAAIAAACRQWKVGDLVLAKVKGFPAWPAAVSEPEKWGYTTDWKKVLVHFFGTQQIAFCNPADVEAFTEEKKHSLLTKRHAKGSDFVRAVKEIIESYEKLKQQEQAGYPKSAEEATLESAENATLLPQVSENLTGTSIDTQMKTDPNHGRDESTLLNEDASAAEQMLALRNKACDSALAKEPRKIATYSSRRRNGGARSQKCAPQKKIGSVQRSKSSSRLQSDKFQRSLQQCSNGGQSIDDAEDGALRRRKRIRRSSGHSESDDVASSALNSHGSDEENASEIATVESNNNARTEGNGVDSGSKVENSDTGGQFLEGDYELHKGLNFQISTMVKRKKRKPTRKRGTSDAVDPPAKVGAEAVLEVGARDNVHTSQNSLERFTERPCEEKGDEHLPLVKRARVRMSRAFYGDLEANGSSQVEERSSKDTLVSATAQTSPSDIVSCHDTSAAEESKVFEVSPKLSGDMVTVVQSPVEKPSDGMYPAEACVHTLGDREFATGWNELSKAPDDEAAGPQSNQVRSLPADEAQAAGVAEAVCSGDLQPMKLPTSESDLPVVQCVHQVSKIETPLDPIIVDFSAEEASGMCSSGIPSQLSGQHKSQDQDACGSLYNSRESLNEEGDINVGCVAQVVQHRSQDQDAGDSLGNSCESLNEEGDRNDDCVAQVAHCRSQVQDACDPLDNSRESLNEEGDRNDGCVAQVVQEKCQDQDACNSLDNSRESLNEEGDRNDGCVAQVAHHRSQVQDAFDPLDNSRESLNEVGDRNDGCVAQVVQEKCQDQDACNSLDNSRESLNEEGDRYDGCVAQVAHHRSQVQDACDSLDHSRESLNEEGDRNDRCVAQVVQDKCQDQDACDSLENFRESLNEEVDRNDGCVAQVVQFESVELSPSSCLMVNKQETEDMQKAENMLLKEEYENVNEKYDNVKPIQTTPNPPISASERDVMVDENGPPNESGYSKCEDAVEDSRHLEVIGEADDQEQQVQTNNSVSVSENLSREKMSLSPANIADTLARGTPHSNSVCHISTAESANDMQNNSSCSPNVHSGEKKPVCDTIAKEEEKIEAGVCQGQKVVTSDVQTTRESFEDALSSLVRTKESIGRATRLAMDLMKVGISGKAMEILAHTLESESNLQRRVDLFFLVDSIAQCSKGMKGDAGCVYLSAIQVILPRLLVAAVPAGATTQENRRQCLKVLRVWLERRILPESVIRHHIRELDSHSVAPACLYSRRSARTERSLDDPVRDMEGMLVDEYGSNSTLQLPGFCMPAMLKDEEEGSDSEDDEDFESVTPEHESRIIEGNVSSSTAERHTLILEDVDGELEMEDVAPPWETGNTDQAENTKLGQHFRSVSVTSHQHVSLTSPPLASSSPPAPSSQQAQCDSYSNGFDSGGYSNMHQGDHPRLNPPPLPGNTVHYQGPESCYSSGVHLTNNSMPQAADGSNFQHRPYPGHPHSHPHAHPPPPPHHQYSSYTEPGHHMKSRRDGPSYRSHYGPNFDERNFHDNHERMRHAPPYENHRDNWRYPPSSSSTTTYGSRYQEKHKGPYPYNGGPPRESGRFQNSRWDHPPRPSYNNNRHSFQPKPHSEGGGPPVPVGMRDPGMWHQRGD